MFTATATFLLVAIAAATVAAQTPEDCYCCNDANEEAALLHAEIHEPSDGLLVLECVEDELGDPSVLCHVRSQRDAIAKEEESLAAGGVEAPDPPAGSQQQQLLPSIEDLIAASRAQLRIAIRRALHRAMHRHSDWFAPEYHAKVFVTECGAPDEELLTIVASMQLDARFDVEIVRRGFERWIEISWHRAAAAAAADLSTRSPAASPAA